MLAVSFGIQMLIMGGINIHIVPFLTDIGIERVKAGNMMGLMVFFTIPSRFLSGMAVDFVGKQRLNYLLVIGFLLQTLGISILLFSRNIVAVYLFLIL